MTSYLRGTGDRTTCDIDHTQNSAQLFLLQTLYYPKPHWKPLIQALPPEGTQQGNTHQSVRGTCLELVKTHVLHCLWSTQVFHSEVLEAKKQIQISPNNPALRPTSSFLFLSLPLLQRAQSLAVINPSFVLEQSDRPTVLSENIQEEDSDFAPRAAQGHQAARNLDQLSSLQSYD